MPRKAKTKKNLTAAVEAAENLMDGLGLDRTEEGKNKTPERMIKYLDEFCQPFDVEDLLGPHRTFEAKNYRGMITQTRIPFKALCEHHMVPVMGFAAVGYIPNERIVGLSKLTRLVQAVGKEAPSTQEYANQRIVDLLDQYLQPKGVIVLIEAEHGCMACRGVNVSGIITSTSSLHGVFRDVPQARTEFFEIVSRGETRI